MAFAYLASSSSSPDYSKLFKIDLDTFTEVGFTISAHIRSVSGGLIYNGYVYYVGTNTTAPPSTGSYLIKVDLATFTEVDFMFLSTSTTTPSCILDDTTGHAYISYGFPTTVDKVDLSTFTVVDTVTIGSTRPIRAIDTVAGYLYLATLSGAVTVEKIDITTMTSVGTLLLGSAGGFTISSCSGGMVLQGTPSYAYFYTIFLSGLYHARVTAVDLSTFTVGTTTELSIDQNFTTNFPILDGSGRGYFPGQSGASLGKVSRINLIGVPSESVVTFSAGEGAAQAAMMYPDYSNALFSTNNSFKTIKQINLSTFTVTNTLTLSVTSNSPVICLYAATIPTIFLSTATLTPSCFVGEDAISTSFDVSNSGSGTLTYTIINDGDWLSCVPTSGSVDAGDPPDTITVNYNTSSKPVGTYNCTIMVTDIHATNNPQYISVTLTVNPPTSEQRMRGLRWFDGEADQGFYLGDR